MEYSFDFQMSQIHVLLAWFSVTIFLVRGLAYQFGAEWELDSRLSVLVFGIDFLLTITGLSLWALQRLNPMYDGWLMGKLIGLACYTFFAHWAMSRNAFHLQSYLLALLSLAYMMGVSMTRSPWLGL